MNRYLALKQDDKYLLERRKEGFDLSKFTVVGNPTISDDGVVSGFSENNYLRVTSNLSFGSSSWEITGNFVFSSYSYMQAIFSGANNAYAPLLYVFNTGMQLHIPSVQGTWGWQLVNANYNFVNNEEYYYKVGWDGDNYYIKISNDNGYTYSTLQILAGIALLDGSGAFGLCIGENPSQTDRYFKGSIDLKKFFITVDGKEVFTGAKEQFYILRS